MRKQLLCLAAAAMPLLAACSDPPESEPQEVTPTDGVWITSPTWADRYQTESTTLELQGGAFVPAGSSCPAIWGIVGPGYTVTWANETTGAAGAATTRLSCLLQVNVFWETDPIPLAPGANTIRVTARDAQGRIGTDTLLVERTGN